MFMIIILMNKLPPNSVGTKLRNFLKSVVLIYASKENQIINEVQPYFTPHKCHNSCQNHCSEHPLLTIIYKD